MDSPKDLSEFGFVVFQDGYWNSKRELEIYF